MGGGFGRYALLPKVYFTYFAQMVIILFHSFLSKVNLIFIQRL